MIHLHSLVTESNYVKLNWTRPKFLPEMYQLKFAVTMKPIYASIQETSDSVVTKTVNLSSEITSVKISSLLPRSICTMNLLAVFNPASIDSGLAITGTAVAAVTSKRNLV